MKILGVSIILFKTLFTCANLSIYLCYQENSRNVKSTCVFMGLNSLGKNLGPPQKKLVYTQNRPTNKRANK